ncbi:probable cytochrome P450 9f2 [Phlebotomus argentipes]|uniref:probable cytochrome P450 9f2 n=1 Tax=Phlebotomus argentipes TaxID=94469 RepID=UPI002893006B|nr:probable cytochrome P450 9f2 [Phlebotomus argentipes]
MVFWFLVFSVVAAVAFYLYQFGTKNEDFFLERGIKFRKPVFLFGNYFKLVTKQINLYDFVIDVTRQFPKEKLMGLFEFRKPIIVVLDPEIAKQLAIKEFDSFTDHQPFFSQDVDPLIGNTLFHLKGQKWKDMRSTLSPAFTGSKMRLMCSLMMEICEQMIDFVQAEINEKGPQTYEVKELLTRLTTDVIGSCAFGVKVNSMNAKENDFYKTTRKLLNFSSLKVQFRFMAYRMAPKLMQFLKITMFDADGKAFIHDLVMNTIKTREEKNIVRHDMINLLMEAKRGNLAHTTTEKDSAGFATVEESEIGMKKSTKKNWTDDEVVAQCFIFFVAGFEGLSTFASFIIYEIVLHQDVQEKLFIEISEMNKQLGGKSLNYDSIQKLKYLDMVVSEGLRMWAGLVFDRVCTRDFTLKYDEGKEYNFKSGDVVWFPSLGYHRSPDFFPNPNKFDPERFNDENKESIHPMTFVPFGAGPRNCIGSRFALMELKAIVYYSVLNFHLEPTEKTQIPVKLACNFLGLQSERGIHVQFRPRLPK